MSPWAPARRLLSFDPPQMKIDADVRKCVVFIGHGSDAPGAEHFTAKATGFFVSYKGFSHLVTARHVAMRIGDAPFQVRVNKKDGGSGLVTYDPETDPMDKWMLHDDPNVDVAAVLFPYALQGGDLDQLAIPEQLLPIEERLSFHGIGIGDTCYAIGLFRLMQGKKRNFPIVHTGAIAAMPSDEPIPVRDGDVLRHVNGYVVEMSNLRGLSGSPVLVRSTINAVIRRVNMRKGQPPEVKGDAIISAPNQDLYLLGVWASSWDASADEVLALEYGREVRVPVGFGTVIPTQRLREVLDQPAGEALRAEMLRRVELGNGSR